MATLALAAFAVVLAWVAPASAAPTPPDSLAELQRRFASGSPMDPTLLPLAERVVAQRAQSPRVTTEQVAEAYEWLGRVRLARSEPAAADTVFARALALRRSARRTDAGSLAASLGWLAEAQRADRRTVLAESTATEALGLLQRAATPDTALEVRLRGTLGNALAERRESVRACEQLARAVLLAESRAQPDSLQLGQACRNLGRALMGAGDLVGARAMYARAARIQQAALGERHPELATTLFMSAMAASEAGDYVAQRDFAERALTLRERLYGPDHPVVAIAAATLGNALRNLGDPDAALPYYERALAIHRRAARPSPYELAVALNNLGAALIQRRDGARARNLLEEARTVRERAFGPGAGSGVWADTRLAQAMLLAGDLPAARARIDSAVSRVDPAREAGRGLDLIDALQVQGDVAFVDRRLEPALLSYARAHALCDRLLGAASPHTLDALANRAIAHAAVGRPTEAWADARALERASREFMQASARALSEHEALSLDRTRASGLDVMLALAARTPVLPAESRIELADAVVRARLLVLDQAADERRLLRREALALAAPVRELEQARESLASTLVESLRQDRAPDSSLSLARVRRESAERALAAQSARFARDLQRSDAGYAQVVAALPPGSALVSYVRHDAPDARIPSPGQPESVVVAGRRYSALVTRSGSTAPEIVPIAPAPQLEAGVARWLEACATPPPANAALARAAERRCTALGRTVRALMWDPLARHLAGATRVFVVPAGALHAVPWLALPADPQGTLAEHGPLIHRLTAERDLLPWDHSERGGRGLLALGGADFDHGGAGDREWLAAAVRESHADSSRLRFSPLPHTADEVAEVAAQWRAAPWADASEAVTLTGAAASEAAFGQLAPGRRVLHVATHGFALGDAAPVRAGSRAVGAVTAAGTRLERARHMALLPGLALAGANAPVATGGEDGFLTAEEILSLDLTGTEWAVLSACETGRSDPEAAEAVQGLQRAFRRAGVHTVIMSLWAVDDAATRAWMAQLYAARGPQRLDTAQAVRAACRTVLHERRARGLDTHPFHWAAFVAAGDWR